MSLTLVAALSPALLFGAATAPEDATALGRREYVSNCAICHGMDAHGEGPYGMFLKAPPKDLSRLAAENGGVFPFEELYRTIDGRADVALHGPREMPVWGWEYNEEARRRYAPMLGEEQVETYVTRRILALIRYLESIQRE
ncbi:MAG: cytochrome c [Pseudomonadota bacterium]